MKLLERELTTFIPAGKINNVFVTKTRTYLTPVEDSAKKLIRKNNYIEAIKSIVKLFRAEFTIAANSCLSYLEDELYRYCNENDLKIERRQLVKGFAKAYAYILSHKFNQFYKRLDIDIYNIEDYLRKKLSKQNIVVIGLAPDPVAIYRMPGKSQVILATSFSNLHIEQVLSNLIFGEINRAFNFVTQKKLSIDTVTCFEGLFYDNSLNMKGSLLYDLNNTSICSLKIKDFDIIMNYNDLENLEEIPFKYTYRFDHHLSIFNNMIGFLKKINTVIDYV